MHTGEQFATPKTLGYVAAKISRAICTLLRKGHLVTPPQHLKAVEGQRRYNTSRGGTTEPGDPLSMRFCS